MGGDSTGAAGQVPSGTGIRLEAELGSFSLEEGMSVNPSPIAPAPMAFGNYLQPIGVFNHFTRRVWVVTGMAVQRGRDGEEEFFVTLTEATPNSNYPPSSQVFQVGPDEYEDLALDDLITISLRREAGVLDGD